VFFLAPAPAPAKLSLMRIWIGDWFVRMVLDLVRPADATRL
jgi:hypothetical protein